MSLIFGNKFRCDFMYEKEVSLKKLFDLKTDVYCFINDKWFNAKQEDEILKELNSKRWDLDMWEPIVSISDKVLFSGGRLYFKLTDDKGLFVREKAFQCFSQVGRYSPEEGEVLLDEEIDEDIYRNVQEFIPKFNSISEVNEELKGKKIDLRKTIEKATSKDIGINDDLMLQVEDYGYEFDCGSSIDGYYDKLDELKDEGKWIYVSAVYATDECIPEECDVYEYEICDEFNTIGIDSCFGHCELRVSFDSFAGQINGDFGIMIQGDEISFQINDCGMFASIDPIDDLSEPLNAFVIELMMNIIEFKE